jgi:uncharacterized protein (TIGR03000 family)
MGVTTRVSRFGVLSLILCGLTALVSGATARAEDKVAVLVVKLPADAQLEIGGFKSKQTGEVRKFESPTLAPGKKYSYLLKATWMAEGKEVVRETKVVLSAGQTEEIDVRQLPEKTAENPTDKTPAAGTFKLLSPPPELALMSGETKPVKIQIQRDNFKEPVALLFKDLPADVTVKDANIPSEATSVEVEVTAGAKAKPGSATFAVEATGGAVLQKTTLKLTVTRPVPVVKPIQEATAPSPPKPATLTVQLPADLDLEAGGKKAIPVKVVREGFEGPVKVTFKGAPEGSTMPELTLPASENEGNVELALGKEIKEGSYEVKAAAVGGTARGEATLKLKVMAAPNVAALQLGTPPVLNLQVGGFAKLLPVTVVREGFEGPVTLKFEGLPTGVTISDLTVPADKDKVYAETSVTDSADAAEMDIKIVAVAEAVKAERTLKLKIAKR